MRESLTEIGYAAFYSCYEIETLKIPDGVTAIGEYAFSDCAELKSIEIPSGTAAIGAYAFLNCTALTLIEIPDGLAELAAGVFYNTGLTDVTIPETVTKIGEYAFGYCADLTTVEIPSGIRLIGDFAFWNAGLTSVAISETVTNIGDAAFASCADLESIAVSEKNAVYQSADGVLYDKSVYDKSKTKIICYPAGKSEAEYTIPDGVTTVGAYAFYNCSALTSIEFSDDLTKIGDFAFGNVGLTAVTIPETVTTIGKGAFWNTGLTSVIVPEGVTNIGDAAFAYCADLESITVADANEDYCSVDGILYDKSKTEIICYPAGKSRGPLTDGFTIPDEVTAIAAYAFAKCSELTFVAIPSNVATVGEYAFLSCDGLIAILASAESAPDGWDENWNPDPVPVQWNYNQN
jgi:hypothetical protein